jgi:large subunit ribosomal protein L13
MKCFMAKTGDVAQRWHLVDVSGKVLGRVATRIATVLMGKHRPEYTPHVDTGEFVVVINAAKVKVTGEAKLSQRMFERYSKYPGGRKTIPLGQMLADKPEFVIRETVRRMLPKSKLGDHMLSKLKIYAGSEHPHQAQQPQPLDL